VKRFTILLVDDEERILTFLKTKLRLLKYEVILASNGLEALEQVKGQDPDLIVLDVMLPKMDGFSTLKELRTFSSVPVIMLSARGDASDKIKGLELGADDYLNKPFNPDELVARIEAIRRRSIPSENKNCCHEIAVGSLYVNFDERRIAVSGQELKLTKIEWQLLAELSSNPGHLMFYSDLLSRIWGPEYRDDIQILRTWVSRLRQKVESNPDAPRIITTVPKTGYIFNK
jgi:two-component system KDP operon response regulator KdpE